MEDLNGYGKTQPGTMNGHKGTLAVIMMMKKGSVMFQLCLPYPGHTWPGFQYLIISGRMLPDILSTVKSKITG